jgi:hypothetical protein
VAGSADPAAIVGWDWTPTADSASSSEYGGGGGSSLSSFCAANQSWYDCPSSPPDPPSALDPETKSLALESTSSYLGRVDQ